MRAGGAEWQSGSGSSRRARTPCPRREPAEIILWESLGIFAPAASRVCGHTPGQRAIYAALKPERPFPTLARASASGNSG